jgi:tetratricopeptide (TPR) repeat protein
MKRCLLGFFTFFITCSGALAQQDAPYDTIISNAKKGLESGKILNQQTPGLAVLLYDQAIAKDAKRFEAYLGKGNAYLDYRMIERALESYNTCLEVSPDNPGCVYGIFYSSFLGSTKYKMTEVPKPMMTQIYNSANAFLAVAPAEGMRQEKANAKIIGNTMKLGIDNLELLKKQQENDVDKLTEANVKVLEEILAPIKATNNPVVVAGMLDRLCEYYFYNSNYAKVKEYANQALTTGQTNTSTYYYLAHVLYNQDKNITEAEKVIDAGEKHSPYTKTQNLRLNMYFTEGKNAYNAKDFTKAVSYFSKYTALKSDNERAWAYLGYSNYNFKKYPDAAKALKSLKAKAAPETSKIYYANLDALIAFAEKPGATAPVIQTIMFETEKQEEAIGKANDLYDQSKFDEAVAALAAPIAYFEQTKDLPNQSWAYLSLGYCHQDGKKYQEAVEAYKKAVAAGGYYQPAYTNLALLLYAVNKDFAEAENVLKAGLIRHPNSEDITERYGLMFKSIGDGAYDAEDYTKAIENYNKALDYIYPSEMLVFLGFAYYKTNNKEECQRTLQSAIMSDSRVTEQYPAVQQILDSFN